MYICIYIWICIHTYMCIYIYKLRGLFFGKEPFICGALLNATPDCSSPSIAHCGESQRESNRRPISAQEWRNRTLVATNSWDEGILVLLQYQKSHIPDRTDITGTGKLVYLNYTQTLSKS